MVRKGSERVEERDDLPFAAEASGHWQYLFSYSVPYTLLILISRNLVNIHRSPPYLHVLDSIMSSAFQGSL